MAAIRQLNPTERQFKPKPEVLLASHKRVLEMLARRDPLEQVLAALVEMIEEQCEGLICSILLVDDNLTFRSGSVESLPESYSKKIEGISILPPYAGPCAMAAHQKKTVIVKNIQSDRRWKPVWADLALAHRLRSCSSTPIFSSEGKVLGTFAMYHENWKDPSLENLFQMEIASYLAGIAIERKQIEASENSRREVLESLNKRLEEAVKIRDEFLSMASHELKTPLTTLILQSKLRVSRLDALPNENGITKQEAKDIFEKDEKQLHRVIRVINEMLDISRIESGKFGIEPEEFDVRELINEIGERFSYELKLSGSSLKVELPEEPVVGRWDRFKLDQMITNLLMNAMKYGNGKPIKILLVSLSEDAVIEVVDNGIGISKDDQARIFGKFERAINDRQAKGLGLGLYIVKKIVEAHRGSISVESTPNEGSTFTVKLPK